MGMKHCGKSSFGKLLAASLNYPFVDLDDLILAKARSRGFFSVRELYRTVGLKIFQEYETEALNIIHNARESRPSVLSLGGGYADNNTAMQTAADIGHRIYLRVPEQTLYRRIIRGGLPPFLEGEASPEELFHQLYLRRDGLYASYAALIVALPDQDLEQNFNLLYSEVKEYINVR